MRKKRKTYSVEEKVAILRRHLIDRVPVSELITEYQLPPTILYCWRNALLEHGVIALRRHGVARLRDVDAIPAQICQLRRENQLLTQKVAELSKYIEGKKKLDAGLKQNRARDKRMTANEKAEILEFVARSPLVARRTLEYLGIPRGTYYRWRKRSNEEGPEGLSNRKVARIKKANDLNLQQAVFSLLHAPPLAHQINRTTWRMVDLYRTLKAQGTPMSAHAIREIIRSAGYKYRRAKVVLTSNDPKYQEKLSRIQRVLSRLRNDERFFSIDEYGPFAIKMKPGRRLVPPGSSPKVPQWQKSKGRLIITAALELSRNQITHFYSERKNTTEMLTLLKMLLRQYRECRKLYLSWDAASWHASQELCELVDKVNGRQFRLVHKGPRVELAPLPAGAQFLNVIESIFSGLAKAVIHNSDYQSLEDAKTAIDRHFKERNEHFRNNPKRAGKKIWGEEPVRSVFSEGHNCKDSRYR